MECSPVRAKVPKSYMVAYFVYMYNTELVCSSSCCVNIILVSSTYICMLVAIAYTVETHLADTSKLWTP